MLQSPAGPSPQQTRLKFKAHWGLRAGDHLYEHIALNRGCVKALHLTGGVPISGTSKVGMETKARQESNSYLLMPKEKHRSMKASLKYGGKPPSVSL